LRIKEVIAEIETDFPEVKALTSDPINIASLAVKTGSMGLYNAVYRVTSTDAAHTTTASLNRHIQTDERGNILQLQFGPETTDLADTLSNAISTIIYAIDVLIGLFSLDQFREKVQQHTLDPVRETGI
jgi:hypothetical protein